MGVVFNSFSLLLCLVLPARARQQGRASSMQKLPQVDAQE
jgi:hypothetical protein